MAAEREATFALARGPALGGGVTGTLSYRRHPTDEAFETVELDEEPWMKGPALIGLLELRHLVPASGCGVLGRGHG